MWRISLFRPAFWLARPPPCCSTRRTLSTLADRSRSCPYLNARIDATAGANADRDNALATERLLAADVRRLWHPYTSATQPVPCLAVSHASGVTLTLEDGRELIDGMSSWWAAVHGYAVPELDEAASQQLGSMAHVMFGGLTHRPAVRLAELLVQVTPEPLQRVFLCDSGSIAVEVAIKMALQYWRARGIEGRSRLLTVRGGYHGDTFGAMAVCDPVNGMHVEMFGGVLAKHLFAPRPAPLFGQPCAEKDVEEFATMLREHEHELAARLDAAADTDSAMASLAKQLQATLASATADTATSISPLDELRLRREHHALRQRHWFEGRPTIAGGPKDLAWLHGEVERLHHFYLTLRGGRS